MKLFDAMIRLEAHAILPGQVPELTPLVLSPATEAKVVFPAAARMGFVSEAPIEVPWGLSPLAAGPVIVRRLRIVVPGVPLTMWIDFPNMLQLLPGQKVVAHMPPEIRNPEGPWPNIVLD